MAETYSDQEKKEKKDKKKQQEKRDSKEYSKRLEKNKLKLDLQQLKELVEQWIVDKQLFESIKKDNQISPEEFQEVINDVDIRALFEKLDEIEKFEDIDNILPPNTRVSKQEYLAALHDPTQRDQVMAKFNASLNIIFTNYKWSISKRNMFSRYVGLLNESLIPLQENIIDLKNSLSS